MKVHQKKAIRNFHIKETFVDAYCNVYSCIQHTNLLRSRLAPTRVLQGHHQTIRLMSQTAKEMKLTSEVHVNACKQISLTK